MILGALWGLWHVLINTSHAALYCGLFVPHLLVMWDGTLPLIAYRVLMVWVYRHTGSLPLGMLLHVFYTAILVTLGPSGVTPAQQLLYDALFLAALGVVVTAIVVLANRWHLTRQHRYGNGWLEKGVALRCDEQIPGYRKQVNSHEYQTLSCRTDR